MKPFADEKAAQVDAARDEATSSEPFLLAQAAPGGAPQPPAAPAEEQPPSGALATPPAATKKRWDELVRRVRITKPAARTEADQVIATFLGTRSGAGLVDDLYRVLSKKARLVSRVVIDFRDKTTIAQEEDEVEVEGQQEGEAGLFSPGRRYAPVYTVYVGWDGYPGADNDMGSHVSGIFTSLVSGRSMMVETLFHELLHVWFIHAFTDPARYGDDDSPATGHTTFNGPAGAYDSIDSRFRNRLKAMIAELEPIEKAQRRKNKASR